VGERMIMDMNKYVTLQLVDYLGEYLIEPTEEEGDSDCHFDKPKMFSSVKNL
jgi:hypothetical protein